MYEYFHKPSCTCFLFILEVSTQRLHGHNANILLVWDYLPVHLLWILVRRQPDGLSTNLMEYLPCLKHKDCMEIRLRLTKLVWDYFTYTYYRYSFDDNQMVYPQTLPTLPYTEHKPYSTVHWRWRHSTILYPLLLYFQRDLESTP
jgi:hypothetical protein